MLNYHVISNGILAMPGVIGGRSKYGRSVWSSVEQKYGWLLL